MSEKLEGGCACAAIRYEVTGPPMYVHCCHCKECQRHTGSAFVLNALIETDRIRVKSGELVSVPVPTESGSPHDIYHCSKCQTAVMSDYGGRKGVRFLRVGTLDNPSKMPPDVHIFTRSRLSWVGLPDDALKFEIYYDRARIWPEKSLKRLQAAEGVK